MNKLLCILLLSAWALTAQADSGYYAKALDGLSGRELMEALRRVVRTRHNVMPQLDDQLLWQCLAVTDGNDDGTVRDIFSPEIAKLSDETVTFCHIAHPSWAADTYPYTLDISLDLHNIYPCNAQVAQLKRDLAAWTVDNATFDNGVCRIGSGELNGTIIGAYEPCDTYKGDIARALMYVAVCYGGEWKWQGQSWNLFNDGAFPVLHSASRQLLLDWCQLDPVDDRERARNQAVYALQGNRNPFVDYPELARHIWGDLQDQPFNSTDETDSGQYLRPTYQLGERIWLNSHFVPDDAAWLYGGKTIDGKYIESSSLGIGLHELHFTADGVTGRITIEITR